MRWAILGLLSCLLATALGEPAPALKTQVNRATCTLPDLYEADIVELQEGLDAGCFTSVDLIKAYFARIEEVNLQGPGLRAIIETNPSALAIAAALDEERSIHGKRSLLHGIPVLVKDNVATVAEEGMNTTAGSFALLNSVVPRDAGIVTRLRRAGAIILGKANLSEFAHFRGNLANGWSGRGGQTSSAYFPAGDPCGSSSGSGVGASIGLTTVAIGTETDGSITCPSSQNNLVGIKPTVGLTSRAGVVPISEHQDTVGPMVRSMSDAAIVLSVIAGPDPNDNFTLAQPHPVPDFTRALKKDALVGKRIGVPRMLNSNDPDVQAAFNDALVTLANLGATIVDPADLPDTAEIRRSGNETVVLDVDFKIQLNAWFSSLLSQPTGVQSLSDLITFNNDNPELEEPPGFTSQTTLIASNATNGRDDAFFTSLGFNVDLGGARGIDAALAQFNLDALVLPSRGSVTGPAAIVGYPIVTVPLGFFPANKTITSTGPLTVFPAPNMPFGISFFASKFSEFELIGFGYAFEQATMVRLKQKAFEAAIPKTQLIDVM